MEKARDRTCRSERSVSDHQASLRSAGLRATAQRVDILTALEHAGRPLSLEQVHARLPGRVDLSTLYRNMREFSEAGLVRSVDLRHGHAHYELVQGEEHHHLICTSCGHVEAFTLPLCDDLERVVLRRAVSFDSVMDHALELYGTCVSCAGGVQR